MPDFQISLRDVSDVLQVSLNGTNTAISVTDQSNYATSTEPGHELADFATFRRILITRPDGTTYNMSSIGDGDVVINAGDTAGTDTYTILSTDEDGLWTFKLTSVPDWNNADQYDLGLDFVYYGAKFYKALTTNTNKQPDVETADWEEVTESQLSSKYVVTEKYVIKAFEICPCLAEKLKLWAQDSACNVCEESRYSKTVLDLIRYDKSIQGLMNQQAYAEVTNVLNAMKAICHC